MRILIGTPIHKNQEHLFEQWAQSVSQIDYPFDLLLVDSSPDWGYTEHAKKVLEKYHIKNWQIEHFDINQAQPEGERLGRSREIMRKKVLQENYKGWLNWECMYLLLPDSLEKLIEVLNVGGYALISHIPNAKEISLEATTLFGVDLVKRESLERYGFLVNYPDMPNIWYGNGLWLKRRLIRDGYKIVELDISNPNHLNKYKRKNGLRLNIGCGRKFKDGYINIDIQEPCDLKHDLRQPLPFQDNTVDEIFSEGNVISLFTREEWIKVKAELARVLKPGGKIDITFLDFEYILKAFIENKEQQRWGWWIQTIFAGQQNEHDHSKNGFTPDRLMQDLEAEGIEKISLEKLSPPEDVRLIGFKKILLTILLFVLFIPRSIWADLSYIATDLTEDPNDSPSTFIASLSSTSRRKEKQISSKIPYQSLQFQL